MPSPTPRFCLRHPHPPNTSVRPHNPKQHAGAHADTRATSCHTHTHRRTPIRTETSSRIYIWMHLTLTHTPIHIPHPPHIYAPRDTFVAMQLHLRVHTHTYVYPRVHTHARSPQTARIPNVPDTQHYCGSSRLVFVCKHLRYFLTSMFLFPRTYRLSCFVS